MQGVVPIQYRGGSRRHVVDPKARLHQHGVMDLGIVAARIDVHFVTESGKGAREFTDVHVHAAAVARTGLRQRRRVIGEDGQTNHFVSLPAPFENQRGHF